MKLGLIVTLSLAAGAIFAVDLARVDINAQKDGIVLEKEAKAPVKSSYASWLKSKGTDTQFVTFHMPVSEEWGEMTFSFTPDKDGTADIQLAGQWAKNAKDRSFVVYDDVEINGVLLPNGSFEEQNKQGKLKNWRLGKMASVVDGGKTGDKAVCVNHDNRAMFPLKVEGGKTYTLKACVKKAPAPVK